VLEKHIREYFSLVSEDQGGGDYSHVIVLHNSPDVPWDEVKDLSTNLRRGWYELAQLSREDRIDFTRDYWLSKLPYRPKLQESIENFFERIDDIGVVLAQKREDLPYFAHLIYALKDDEGFFHGQAAMGEEDLETLIRVFPETIFPEDYLAFMEIHNGFSKTTDSGILCTHGIGEANRRFQQYMGPSNPLTTKKGEVVDPNNLIPFYESFGMPVFQCFWKDWYPENEMGNVYYSGITHTISDVVTTDESAENLAFHTFLDWLLFYLEKPVD